MSKKKFKKYCDEVHCGCHSADEIDAVIKSGEKYKIDLIMNLVEDNYHIDFDEKNLQIRLNIKSYDDSADGNPIVKAYASIPIDTFEDLRLNTKTYLRALASRIVSKIPVVIRERKREAFEGAVDIMFACDIMYYSDFDSHKKCKHEFEFDYDKSGGPHDGTPYCSERCGGDKKHVCEWGLKEDKYKFLSPKELEELSEKQLKEEMNFDGDKIDGNLIGDVPPETPNEDSMKEYLDRYVKTGDYRLVNCDGCVAKDNESKCRDMIMHGECKNAKPEPKFNIGDVIVNKFNENDTMEVRDITDKGYRGWGTFFIRFEDQICWKLKEN